MPVTTAVIRCRPLPRHLMVAVLLALFGAGEPPVAQPMAAAPALQAGVAVTYRLVDTWTDAPWALVAGRFGRVVDISSAPDGTIYVLDGAHAAVHVLAPDGTPRSGG